MVLLTYKLSNKPVTNFEHYTGPVSPSHRCVLQFKRVKTEQFTISLSAGNTCIMHACGVRALVKNIAQKGNVISLSCTKFEKLSDSFPYALH